MDLFTQIKMAVSVKEAAEYYGLEVERVATWSAVPSTMTVHPA